MTAAEWLAFWRHPNFRVQPGNISIEQAVAAFSRQDNFAAISASERWLFQVEPKAAFLLFWSMTRIATVSEDRPDIAREVYGRGLGNGRKRLSRGNPRKSGLKIKPRENRQRCDQFVLHEKAKRFPNKTKQWEPSFKFIMRRWPRKGARGAKREKAREIFLPRTTGNTRTGEE